MSRCAGDGGRSTRRYATAVEGFDRDWAGAGAKAKAGGSWSRSWRWQSSQEAEGVARLHDLAGIWEGTGAGGKKGPPQDPNLEDAPNCGSGICCRVGSLSSTTPSSQPDTKTTRMTIGALTLHKLTKANGALCIPAILSLVRRPLSSQQL